jgi:hypothetical protein
LLRSLRRSRSHAFSTSLAVVSDDRSNRARKWCTAHLLVRYICPYLAPRMCFCCAWGAATEAQLAPAVRRPRSELAVEGELMYGDPHTLPVPLRPTTPSVRPAFSSFHSGRLGPLSGAAGISAMCGWKRIRVGWAEGGGGHSERRKGEWLFRSTFRRLRGTEFSFAALPAQRRRRHHGRRQPLLRTARSGPGPVGRAVPGVPPLLRSSIPPPSPLLGRGTGPGQGRRCIICHRRRHPTSPSPFLPPLPLPTPACAAPGQGPSCPAEPLANTPARPCAQGPGVGGGGGRGGEGREEKRGQAAAARRVGAGEATRAGGAARRSLARAESGARLSARRARSLAWWARAIGGRGGGDGVGGEKEGREGAGAG